MTNDNGLTQADYEAIRKGEAAMRLRLFLSIPLSLRLHLASLCRKGHYDASCTLPRYHKGKCHFK